VSRPKTAATSGNLPTWASALGDRLRRLRNGRSESLADVSAATGISASFLSLLEQGRTDVSLGRLLPLLDHYGLDLAEAVPQAAPSGRGVVRRGERPVLFSPAEGIDVSLAAPDQHRAFVPLVVEYRRGSVMENWSEHDGDEFVFVLAGSLVVEFAADTEPLILDEGDSISFRGRKAHRLSPAHGAAARALVVTTSTAHGL